MKKTILYIDGYNWYHAIFKHRPEWKWLDLNKFARWLRPHDHIAAIKMFSAMVEPQNPTSDARERQDKYFKALKTLPQIRVILGAFQPREVQCRAHCKQVYIVAEEKKTDVNIAVEMLSDATENSVDSMCLISGDSDIQPAVECIARKYPAIDLTVYVPALPNERALRRTDYYRTKNLPVECKFLPLDGFQQNQLPHLVKLPDGTFAARPHAWCPPASSPQITPAR